MRGNQSWCLATAHKMGCCMHNPSMWVEISNISLNREIKCILKIPIIVWNLIGMKLLRHSNLLLVDLVLKLIELEMQSCWRIVLRRFYSKMMIFLWESHLQKKNLKSVEQIHIFVKVQYFYLHHKLSTPIIYNSLSFKFNVLQVAALNVHRWETLLVRLWKTNIQRACCRYPMILPEISFKIVHLHNWRKYTILKI